MITKTSAAQTCIDSSTACNYVINPSFESHDLANCDDLHSNGSAYPCSGSFYDNDYVFHGCNWTSYYSSDYFNTCALTCWGPSVNATNNFQSNGIGSVSAHIGDGYAGIFVYQAPYSNYNSSPGVTYQETIKQTLTTTMLAGKTYILSMWVRLSHVSRYAVSDFWINGTTLNTGSPISNKLGWTFLTTCYTPTTNENTIEIGADYSSLTNLDPGTWTYGFASGQHDNASYYYIDDVEIRPFNVNAGSDILYLFPGCGTQIGTSNGGYTCPKAGATIVYNWSPSTGLSASNVAMPIASPGVTTEYTLSATVSYINDAGLTSVCSSTDAVIVNVVNPVVAITSSDSCNSNRTNTFYATVTPGGAVSYVWTIKDAITGAVIAVPGTGLTTSSPTFDFGTINQNVNVCVVATNSSGCQTPQQCFYYPMCCQLLPGTVKYSNTTYNSLTILGGAAIPIAFGGVITINSGGNLIISSKDVTLDPNTKFVLNGNGRLTILNSYVHGCIAMWDGIYANTTNFVTMTNSRIEDAKRVIIDSVGTASISLANVYLNKNRIGIVFKSTKTSTSSVTIRNTLFTCSDISLAGALPRIPTTVNLTNAATLGAFPTTFMMPPYNTEKSFCGIYSAGASHTGKSNTAIIIGGASNEENVFDKMQYGAFDYVSNMVFQNNVFQNIKSTIAPIIGGSNAAVFVLGPFFGGGSYYTRIGGATTGFKNTFINNDYGVANVLQSALSIENNRFETQTNGVFVSGNNGNNSVSIAHNKFVNNKLGINCDQNSIINTTILENWMDNTTAQGTYADNFAIRCTEAVPSTNPYSYPAYNIQNNYITGYFNGIFTTKTFLATITDNEVHMRPDYSSGNFQSGITAVNTGAIDVANNTIDMPIGTTANWSHNGIFIDCNSEPKVRCNNTNYICNGILANYLNLTVPGYGIYTNNMQNAAIGFWLNAGGEIGHQYYNTTSYSADNQWNSCTNETFVSSGSNNYSGTGARFYTRNTSPYNIVFPAGPGINLTGIPATGGLAGVCASSATPTLNLRTNGAGQDVALMQYAQEIATDNMSFGEYEESTKQNARRQLYSSLALKQIDRSIKDDFSTFMNAEQHTSTGLFFVVDSLINSGDSINLQKAAQQNNAITAITDIDQTQQQLNNLYVSYLNNKRSLTTADIKAMETIAELCPITHGSAVHQARSILFNITYKRYVNTCEFSDDTKQSRFAQTTDNKIQTTDVKLYPNPSNGNVTIETADNLSYNIAVYNVLGEKVFYNTVTNKQNINLNHLPSATYIVLIKYNDGIIKTERISIIH